jgi:nucleotide-binding universal stress UspA family protein
MHRAIAIGLGGAGSWQALAWAIEEAERTHTRLVLMHVCAPASPLDLYTGDPTTAEVELIDPNLARALGNARARLGGHRVVLKIRSGDPAGRLVEASAGVGLLVIGAGQDGHTVRRILRHAHCPVVVVRPGAPFAGRVVVGVDGSVASQTALEFAFAYAAEHHLPLAAVRVATFADPEPLAADVEVWARKYPDVALHMAVVGGSVPDALIRAADGARLLVVGDKRRGVIGRARTGDVPLTVAAGAPGPVAVVPADQREAEPL